MNILDSCTFYEVDQTKLNSEQLRNFVGDSLDEGSLIISLEEIKNADIPEEAIDWESGGFDREELNYILTDKIGRLPHYLVIACGCRWNGASGYMFTDEITKTCERSYDISLDLVEEGRRDVIDYGEEQGEFDNEDDANECAMKYADAHRMYDVVSIYDREEKHWFN